MDGAGQLPGVGGTLAVSLVSLGLVCLVAYASLRWLGRRGVGRGSGPIEVLARCPLEPRRTLYLIETGGRRFLVGVGDGPMTMLAEVDPGDVTDGHGAVAVAAAVPPRRNFADILARVGRRGSDAPPT